MAKRWTPDDIFALQNMATHLPVVRIAENLDRPVGGVVFKAHQLGLSLRSRAMERTMESQNASRFDPGPSGFDG